MDIYEVKTKSDRVFRVAIENRSQLARLNRVIHKNKEKDQEVFVDVKCITNGIHNIKDFEAISESLL